MSSNMRPRRTLVRWFLLSYDASSLILRIRGYVTAVVRWSFVGQVSCFFSAFLCFFFSDVFCPVLTKATKLILLVSLQELRGVYRYQFCLSFVALSLSKSSPLMANLWRLLYLFYLRFFFYLNAINSSFFKFYSGYLFKIENQIKFF